MTADEGRADDVTSYENTLGTPSRWAEHFQNGAADSGDEDANILWLSEYLEICKRGSSSDGDESLRDYNADFQHILQSRRPGSLRDQLVQSLVDEMKDEVTPLLIAIAANPDGTKCTATPQLLTSVRTGDNGVVAGTWDCCNVVVHLSTEPSLPGLVSRHASYVASVVEDNMEITAPLCAYMMCQGRRFLVAAKIPLRADAGKATKWMGVKHATGNLAVKLNAPRLHYEPMQVCYGADARLYLVPGMNLASNAEYSLQHPVCLLGFAAVDSSPAPEQLDRLMIDLHPPTASPTFVREQFRRNGLPLRKMRELYECEMFQNPKYNKVRDLLVIEMAARTLKQIACVEIATNKGATSEDDLFSRYFHTLAEDGDAWAVLAPLVQAKFGLRATPMLPQAVRAAAVKYFRHLLGVPADGQKVTLRSSPLSHQVGIHFLFGLRKTSVIISSLEEVYKTRSVSDVDHLQQARLAVLYKHQVDQLGVSQRDLLERKRKSLLQKLLGAEQRCPNPFTSACLLEYVARETAEPINGAGSRARVEWNRKRLELMQRAVELKRKAWPGGDYERVEAAKSMLGRCLVAIELSGEDAPDGILRWVREAAKSLAHAASSAAPSDSMNDSLSEGAQRSPEMDVFESHSIVLQFADRERIETVLRTTRTAKRDTSPKKKERKMREQSAAASDATARTPPANTRSRSAKKKRKRKERPASCTPAAERQLVPRGHEAVDGPDDTADSMLEPTPLIPPRSATAEPPQTQYDSTATKTLPLIRAVSSIRGDKEYEMKLSEKAARTDYQWWQSKHKHLTSKYEKLKRLQQREEELSEKRALIAHQQQAISAQMDLNKCLSKQMLLQRREYIREVRSARKNAVKDARMRLLTAKSRIREECHNETDNNKVTIETLSLLHRQEKTDAANHVKMQRMAVTAAKNEKQMKHEQNCSDVYDERLGERQQQMEFFQRETLQLVKGTSQLLQKIRELSDEGLAIEA